MKLQRLASEAERLVTPELASGETFRPKDATVRPLLEPCDRDVELGAYDATISDLIASTARYDPTIDALAAERIHQMLRLTRREARDPGIWRFLSVVHRPDFIRHRWENKSWATMKTRFWSPGTRPDSNAIYRLWWIAELTVHEGDYSLTRGVFGSQSLVNGIFVRNFSHYRPAVEACAQVLGQAPAELVEQVTRRFNGVLSTIPIESQSRGALVDLLAWIKDEVGGSSADEEYRAR